MFVPLNITVKNNFNVKFIYLELTQMKLTTFSNQQL